MNFFDPLPRGEADIGVFDYPWPHDVWSDKGNLKSPEAHYETMPLSDIAKTRPQDLIHRRGVAVFWCTWPLIGKQVRIIEESFGLTVKTGGAWSKRTRSGALRLGPGKIVRTVCEPFLIACKPKHQLKARGAARNLIETMEALEVPGLAREHSRKPDEFYDLLESLTPGWTRLDVFTRATRKGWRGWGKEKNKFDR